ncbi:MAG: type II secretion system F family protein [Ktedonobacterales bacterium]
MRAWLGMISPADIVLSTGAAVLIGVLAAGGIWLIFVGLQRAIENRTESVLDRMNKYGAAGLPGYPAVPEKKRRRRLFPFLPDGRRRVVVEAATADRGFTATLGRDLARADIRITVGEYMVMTCVLTSVGALLGFALPIGGHILLGVVLAIAGFYGPRYYVTSRKRSRQRAFDSQLSDAISMMANSLKSGFALLQSLELVSHDSPAPTSQEFERVVREVGFGTSVETALSHLVDRMESTDLELLVTAINVQREVGGNLVEVLAIISATIRDRVRLMGEVRSMTAQQQYSGYVIACLPIGLALILLIINPGYMLGVFRDTTWFGWTMLSCSLVMIVAGFLIIRQIVHIKV